MSTIVTRAGKGSPLTHTEMDSNFTNLNTDKIEVSSITSATDKATPDDTDVLSLVDTILKKVTWANIKATLKTYFDTLYQAAGSYGDVTGQASSVDSEIALFSGTGGKTIKRASMTGLVKAASGVASAATAGTDYVKPDTTSALSAGYTATDYPAGTKSSGTFTPDPASGNFQYAVNGGAHTLAPPASSCTMIIQYTNNGSAGAITTSGFTKVSGSFTTTNGDDFFCFITRCNGFSSLDIKALQ